ncbi:citrate/2-methylcitrate synthase [Pelosinus baikalensis]|uniref:Citrate synthase n=1 Tax=Pelosinus baikalensis TaxID=2892015 RepID=A0ABS8HYT2_9FIRM|nr:citrate/2-methylcitrate synthase [Pelosinus baikalensis]MCC5468318.1 hypothetical protein [Pelosinus baikalensis]
MVEDVICEVLKISPDVVNDDLCYMSISEWSSLNHINLMLAIEENFDIKIDNELVLTLTSAKAIKKFIYNKGNVNKKCTTKNSSKCNFNHNLKVHRGLHDIFCDLTKITKIDGEKGYFLYRGISIDSLVRNSNFEESAFLMLKGYLPSRKELESFEKELRSLRTLPNEVIDFIKQCKELHPVDALRTIISFLVVFDLSKTDKNPLIILKKGMGIIARTPVIIAYHHRLQNDEMLIAPDETLTHAENFYYMLTGNKADKVISGFLDKDLIIHMDHGAAASTFASRVTIGAGADIYAALTSAIGTLSGESHGGATEKAMTMFEKIRTPENGIKYINDCINNGIPIPGFGNRKYKVPKDPRVKYYEEMVKYLTNGKNKPTTVLIIESIQEIMRSRMEHGLTVNVDFYAGAFYELLGIKKELSVPMFFMGRIVGIVAHIIEQLQDNVLIRPSLKYIGDEDICYTSIESRCS